MSASTEKKNRKAAREAGTDKKLLAAQEEAKKKAVSKRRWTIGAVAVVLFIALILFFNSGYFTTHTDAVTIDGQSYSPAELNYRYVTQYYNWMRTYGNYASMFGLNTDNGVAGLATQTYDESTGETWKDYFMEQTFSSMSQEQALLKYAADKGIELDEEELAEVDTQFDGLEETAKSYGYPNINKFLSASYGSGVDFDLAHQAALDSALASKAYTEIYDSYEYSADELEDYYQGLNGESDIFSYLFHSISAETVTTTAEDGTESSAVTEETMAAAKATADAILAAYEADTDSPDAETAFNAALAAQGIDATATPSGQVRGSDLGVYKEWMLGERESGDAIVVENSGANGYFVVVYQTRSDNHYPTASVRHVLIKAVADEDGTYTDEAKAEAKAKAEELYEQWKSGEASEDSFATLANENSEDSGSNTNGGLYENIYKGQMVDEFDAFCFAEHQKGDTAIVYGESGSYAGYHIVYYVGQGQLYSDYISENALRSEDIEAKLTELTEGYEPVKGFGYRFTT